VAQLSSDNCTNDIIKKVFGVEYGDSGDGQMAVRPGATFIGPAKPASLYPDPECAAV